MRRLLETILWRGPLDNGVWDGTLAVVVPLTTLRNRGVVASSFNSTQPMMVEVRDGSTAIDVVDLSLMTAGNAVPLLFNPSWFLGQGNDLSVIALVPAAFTDIAFSFSLETDDP